MEINNFRLINRDIDVKPPNLVEYDTFDGNIIYTTPWNDLAYIIYKSSNQKYYSFEWNGNGNPITQLKLTFKILVP